MNGEVEPHVLKHYQLRRRIGKGAYGIVWKSVDRHTGELVAVKKIFDAFSNATDAQRTYREVMFLQAFSPHGNVVQLLNVVPAGNDIDLYLVFEFVDTDLHAIIKHRLLQTVHHPYIMYQLFKVMKYIHSGNCIHRDLKPSNILIDKQCHIKLADFGLARSLSLLERERREREEGEGEGVDGRPQMTDYVATRWYRCPEILLGSLWYTTGVDMWSLGCVMAEMIAGKPLFPGTSTINQIEHIVSVLPRPSRGDVEAIGSPYALPLLTQVNRRRPSSLSSLLPRASHEALDLLTHLLHFNPHHRTTAHSALQHPYIKRFHSPSQEPVMRCDVVPKLDDSNQLSICDYRDTIYHSIAKRRRRRRRRERGGGGGEGRERGDEEEGEGGREVVTMVTTNDHTPRKESTTHPSQPHTSHPHQSTAPQPKLADAKKKSPAKIRPFSSILPPPHLSHPHRTHLHSSQKAPDLTITSARILPSSRPHPKRSQPVARGGPSRYASGSYNQTHGVISRSDLDQLKQNIWKH